jgi:argonaute-like protein implicated in RNA metabolism and viral defense
MKIRMIIWLVATVGLCFAAFWFGKRQSLPTSNQFYLSVDRALLEQLNAGNTTNVIEKLDAMLELETLAAMHNRSSLQERDRKILDKTLKQVARYRRQHPWVIETNTNGFPAIELPGAVTWIEEQQHVEIFLRDFDKQ